MKRIMFLIVAAVALSGCSGDEDPLADGVLTIATEGDFAPYSWTTNQKNGSEYAKQISGSNAYVDGYDIMMAQAVADALDVELEVKKVSWDGLIPAVQSGSVDCIFGGMSPTEERKQQIDFTDAYHEDDVNVTVVVNKAGEYTKAQTLDDLTGANIMAQQGTYFVGLLDQIDIAENSAAPATDTNQMIDATITGTVDGYIQDIATATVQVANNEQLMMLDISSEFELDPELTSSSIGVKKGSELTSELNEALATIDDETREEYMQYALELTKES